jgi:hypothetical protein
MRQYLITKGRVFEPETVLLLVEAFDGAWAAVRRFDGINDQNREEIRQALAKRIVELWDASNSDPKTTADAALASFNLKKPDAEASAEISNRATASWTG